MEKLRFEITQKGIPCENLSDELVLGIAKGLGLELPRKVTFKEYKGGNYAQLAPFAYVDSEGAARKTRPFSIRVEIIDALIEDLERAKEALTAE